MVRNRKKDFGQVFTPRYVVKMILDLADYSGESILRKHIIDNSCGDGAFLSEIVERYCDSFLRLYPNDYDGLSIDLSKYIHGIEIDERNYKECLARLANTVARYGISNIEWDVKNCDALTVSGYDSKMDYVVGNPPYIRVHNLKNRDSIKTCSFCGNGMTDAYIAFFDLGIRMLTNSGILGYITPNSYFTSSAGSKMRAYFVDQKILRDVIDFRHTQIFDDATTYTAITILDMKHSEDKVLLHYYNSDLKQIEKTIQVNYDDFCIDGKYFFSDNRGENIIKAVNSFNKSNRHFEVKNGFATLADKVFIDDFSLNSELSRSYSIPVIKASNGKKKSCFYPYDKNGRTLDFDIFKTNAALIDYLEQHKEVLCRRSLENGSKWYAFGRSQGIRDVYLNKYAINTLVRTKDDIKLTKCPRGTGVYSGLYILTDIDELTLRKILINDNFVRYVSCLGKYKSGGYYTFSSKELRNYLEYSYQKMEQI